MRTTVLAVALLAGCSFGVEGNFADSEAGLVSVQSLQLESPMAVGTATRATIETDETALIVDFDVDGMQGQLRFDELLTIIAEGGTGTLRLRHTDGWSGTQTVSLSATTPGTAFDDFGFVDQEVVVQFSTLVGNIEVTGSFVLDVAEGYDC